MELLLLNLSHSVPGQHSQSVTLFQSCAGSTHAWTDTTALGFF